MTLQRSPGQTRQMSLSPSGSEILHRRQVVLKPAEPPNSPLPAMPVETQSGGGATGSSTGTIVGFAVVPGVLLIFFGLWLIYWLYMRNKDRLYPGGGWDREKDPLGISHAGQGWRPGGSQYRAGHREFSDGRRTSRLNRVRGNTACPNGPALHHRRHDYSSSTDSDSEDSDWRHGEYVIRYPGEAARRGYSPPLSNPHRPIPPSFPRPRNRRQRPPLQRSESFESMRGGAYRRQASIQGQSRRRGRYGGVRPISPSLSPRRRSRCRSCSSVRSEPPPSNSPSPQFQLRQKAQSQLIDILFSMASSNILSIFTGVGDLTYSTLDSSETIRPRQTSLSSSATESRPSDSRRSRSVDASDFSFPSIDSRTRHGSSFSSEPSLSHHGRRPRTSPTGISSLVDSLRSDDTGDWREELGLHSPFGQVPWPRRGVSSDISSFRHSDDVLPGGFHHQQWRPGRAWMGTSDRSTSTVIDDMDSANTGSCSSHTDISCDEIDTRRF